MNAETRALVRVSGALASRDPDLIRDALADAERAADPNRVEEVLLQSVLFLGFPSVLNGLSMWREATGRPAPESTEEDPAVWIRRGEELCQRVYGSRYEALREKVRALHPDVDRWMIVDGYGKVLGREALPLRVRELAIVAILAVLDTPPQLSSHLRGAVAAGASADEVDEGLRAIGDLASPAVLERAWSAWLEIRDRP